MVDIRERISGDLEHDIPQYKLWQILLCFPGRQFGFLS